MQDDLIKRLEALHVWPQFVADDHADILSPRQSAGLYEVGNVAHEAASAGRADNARIEALEAELERRKYDGEHTCHERCQRPACVLRRENAALETQLESANQALREQLDIRAALEAKVKEAGEALRLAVAYLSEVPHEPAMKIAATLAKLQEPSHDGK